MASLPSSQTELRPARQISERELAIALVLEFAESGLAHFSLYGYYDDDAEFLRDLALRLKAKLDKAFLNKTTKVVRRLVNYGVLDAQMSSTHKYYIGEPTKQMNYSFLKPGKASLLTRGKTDFTMTPEGEAAFLLRHAYPDPEED